MASQERFSFEWNIYSEILPEYETQFRKWIGALRSNDFKGAAVLDAGCGNGRNSYWALKYGAKELRAFDFDRETVRVASRNLGKFGNTKVTFGSIYKIPFTNKFDLSFSIGVIHHLERPELAIEQLVKATKPGGKILIWVYGYEGNETIVLLVNSLRLFTRKLPPRLVWCLAFPLALGVYSYAKALPSNHSYIKQLRSLSFKNIHSIVFDQMLPKIARYYSRAEAMQLLSVPNVEVVKTYRVNDNSWAVIGTKCTKGSKVSSTKRLK